MRRGWAQSQSRHRCGGGGPSPGADVGTSGSFLSRWPCRSARSASRVFVGMEPRESVAPAPGVFAATASEFEDACLPPVACSPCDTVPYARAHVGKALKRRQQVEAAHEILPCARRVLCQEGEAHAASCRLAMARDAKTSFSVASAEPQLHAASKASGRSSRRVWHESTSGAGATPRRTQRTAP